MLKHRHKSLVLLVTTLMVGTYAVSVIKHFDYHLWYKHKKKEERRGAPIFSFCRRNLGLGKAEWAAMSKV